MGELGSRLLDGHGLTVDPAEGERWLRRAADAGDPDAMRTLGSRLLDGHGLTVDPAEGEHGSARPPTPVTRTPWGNSAPASWTGVGWRSTRLRARGGCGLHRKRIFIRRGRVGL